MWADEDTLLATIRQLAIDNGTPNVMPTIEQMSHIHGLSTWVRKKEGGVRKLSTKLNMIVKPNVLPSNDVDVESRVVMKGSTVFVHNNTHIYPAVVLDKSNKPSGLIVIVFNKKLSRKHVTYGKTPTSQLQWCYAEDIPKDLITVTT